MMNLKKAILIFCICILALSTFACKKESTKYENASTEKPNTSKLTDNPNLNFIEMHNFVIDSITSQETPFFYIVEGKFDISGDNDKKVITVTCTCMDGTTVDDLDLFLSMVFNYIAFNAADQDFRFKAPTTDKEGTYLDFGNVFKYYDLKIDSVDESGNIIRDDYIKAGEDIPVDPRYIKE